MFVIICGRCLVVITHVCILIDLYMMSCTGDTTVSRLVDLLTRVGMLVLPLMAVIAFLWLLEKYVLRFFYKPSLHIIN